MHTLAGKRILVVEDDYLIGMMVSEMLEAAQADVIGPARTRDDGIELARNEPLDAAVLDMNLRGEFSDIVAAELQRREIPFVVASGYGEQPHRQWTGSLVVGKPFTEEHLVGALTRLLGSPH
jgi:DNA-binding response OmpR family regulator